MANYTQKIDKAIYDGKLDINDFEQPQERVGLILALLDQWGVKGRDFDDLKAELIDCLDCLDENGDEIDPWSEA